MVDGGHGHDLPTGGEADGGHPAGAALGDGADFAVAADGGPSGRGGGRQRTFLEGGAVVAGGGVFMRVTLSAATSCAKKPLENETWKYISDSSGMNATGLIESEGSLPRRRTFSLSPRVDGLDHPEDPGVRRGGLAIALQEVLPGRVV
ncbi:hypothetical protein [Streptomyces sp. NPDC093071]|uniref:hypothetical protein n=1 Tax=Streptomyces sp. NPDC093071 TaxID=3366022 RepID=UPI0037F7E46D